MEFGTRNAEWGITKEFISITTFTCQFCHSGLSRILLFSERFPTSGNDRRGFTYGLISKAPNSKLRTSNSKGMTFIELLAALVIIGILSAIVISKLDLAFTSSRASVDGGAYMIASDIRYAQEFAMANRVSKSVVFNSGSSVYTFNPTSKLDPSGQLPSGVTIGGNFTVTFNSLGEPTAGGGGSVTVSGGGLSRTISVVNYTGKVNIT